MRILSTWHQHGDIVAVQEDLVEFSDLPTFWSTFTVQCSYKYITQEAHYRL